MQQDRNHASLILALSRSIERHHLGSKIPDLIVDRLVDELLLAPHFQLQKLQDILNSPDTSIAEHAYKLYMAGELSLSYLISKTQYHLTKQVPQASLPKKMHFSSILGHDAALPLLHGGA